MGNIGKRWAFFSEHRDDLASAGSDFLRNWAPLAGAPAVFSTDSTVYLFG